jgi:class 3 adenylate cyclase/DNA-binding CsgD family transcriptional regulator
VTFVFTDLVGSSRTLTRLGDDAAEELRRAHFALLRTAIADAGGEEVKNLGDGLMVAFASPVDALGAAVAIQRAVAGHNRTHPDRSLEVRVGLHVGEPVRDGNDFFGTAVVVAKRLCDAAQGGQILASDLVAGLVGSRGGFELRSVGSLELKGLDTPLPAVDVAWKRTGEPARPATSRRRVGAGYGPTLVGRDAEMALLEDDLARAAAGELRCVLLVGDSGVGKTRLASDLLARHGDDVTALFARGHPLGDTTAFGLWIEALEPLLQTASAAEVTEACGGFLDDLAGLFHRVAAVRGTAPDREAPRLRLLEGLARLLRHQSDRTPVVAVLDDMHLADASSWEALRYFARHADDARLFIVTTARPAELASREVGSETLFELEQDGLLTRLDIGPLDHHAIHQLAEAVIEQPPPAALIDWLAERSRGNALFTIGLLRALLEEKADLAAPRLERLPEGLAERVAARTRHHPEPARALVELLAVAGRPVTLGDLTALSGQSIEELGPLLVHLLGVRAVVEEERGRELTYSVHHPLVRDVIYQGIGGVRRRILHRQVGRALLEAGRLAEAALHFARSADPGDAEAIGALIEAMRQAERREAYTEALELLGELVELLPDGDRRWLEVLEAMFSGAEWVVDHRADSHTAVAIRALRAIDGVLDAASQDTHRAEVKFRLANFLAWGAGEFDEAEAAARQAQELFAATGDERHSLLAAREVAWIHGLRGDFPAMSAAAEPVVAAADTAGDRFVILQALSAVSYANLFRGRLDEAETALHRAMTIASEDSKAYRLTTLFSQVSSVTAFAGRVTEALAILEEGKALNPAYRDTVLPEIEVFTLWMAGDFPAAVDGAREHVARSPAGTPRRRTMGMACGALAAVELDDPASAERFIARSRAALASRDWSVFWQYTRYADALLNWRRGHGREAVAILRSVCDRMLGMGAKTYPALPLVDLTQVAAAAGDLDAARSAAADLEALAGPLERDLYAGLSALAAGTVELAAGEAALVLARRAVQLLSETGCRAHLARAHDLLGRALPAADRAEAVTAFEAAISLFSACHASWRKDQSLDALRRLGSAGRRAVAAALGPGSLTRRERDVARLAAQGLSAKEIAERLFVGERTVESHLGSVYAKLGVDSKLDLVRRAAELGLSS